MFGWLTVIGLVADIVGVLVLAWDTLPDYRIYRWRKLNKLLHNEEFLRELKQYRERPDDPFVGLAFSARHSGSMTTLRGKLGLKPFDDLAETNDLRAMVSLSEVEVSNAIDREETRLRARWRPPLRLGILLIVAGFALQLLGQLGSMRVLN